MQTALRQSIYNAEHSVFAALKFESNAESYFKEQYPDGEMPADAKFLYEEFLKLRQTREKLQSDIKTDTAGAKTPALKSLSDDITSATAELKRQIESLCNKNPRFCE